MILSINIDYQEAILVVLAAYLAYRFEVARMKREKKYNEVLKIGEEVSEHFLSIVKISDDITDVYDKLLSINDDEVKYETLLRIFSLKNVLFEKLTVMEPLYLRLSAIDNKKKANDVFLKIINNTSRLWSEINHVTTISRIAFFSNMKYTNRNLHIDSSKMLVELSKYRYMRKEYLYFYSFLLNGSYTHSKLDSKFKEIFRNEEYQNIYSEIFDDLNEQIQNKIKEIKNSIENNNK